MKRPNMLLRTLLSGVVALPIVLTGIVLAGGAHARDAAGAAAEDAFLVPFSQPVMRMPGATYTADEAPVLLAQAVDPRVAQLEEQVRRLNGLVEELNFQILQMQDQLRRMQEDNELRFQEMEQRRSDAGGTAPRVQPDDRAAAQQGGQQAAQQGSGDDEFYAALPRVEEGAQVLGQPPRSFGTITFDQNGNATGAGLPDPAEAAGPDDTTVAALPSGSDDDEIYRNSYEFILSGDYDTAEAGFRDLIARYPQSPHAADAHFWLGEALLSQQRPRDAAEVFLAASRSYPDVRKAPETLLKLGVALAAMNQRDVACATFTEVLQRYPQASGALQEQVRQEQSLASC